MEGVPLQNFHNEHCNTLARIPSCIRSNKIDGYEIKASKFASFVGTPDDTAINQRHTPLIRVKSRKIFP